MKKVLYTFLFLFAASICTAAEFTAKVSNSTVEVGQRFQITFTINSGGGNFTAPNFKGFRVLSGPNQSSSTQYINGKVTRSQSIYYTLVAEKEGTFTIGAATIKSHTETLKTKPIKITVTPANPNSQNAQRTRQNNRKTAGQNLSDHIFMRANITKRSAYVGENIGVTFKVYSKVPLRQFLGLEQAPSLTGFWQKEIDPQKNIKTSTEVLNGEQYETVEIQKLLLLPQRSGKLTIDPMAVKLGVQVQSQRRSRSFFDQLLGSYEVKEVIVESKPITIDVKALPKKALPVGFTGAVGNFNMTMTLSKDSVITNDAIDLKITISGNGNLPLINAPDINFPSDFEVYDPETKNEFSTKFNGSSGRKIFQYLVIPRHAGNFKLEPFQFSYFDLKSKQYKTIDTEPLSVVVSKGFEEKNVVYKSNRKSEVELLSSDIRYIHINDLQLFSLDHFFYGSWFFYSLILIVFLLAVGVYLYSIKLHSKNADQIGLRKSKANKIAQKRLANAKKYLNQNEDQLFYEEISTALFGYFSDKFNLSVADLSQEKIIELLENSKAEQVSSIQSEIKTVLQEADMARFAPSSGIDAAILYEKTVDIISKIETLL